MAESDGTLTPLGNLAWHGCGSCGLLIPAPWEYCRHCGEELWAIARQGPRALAWWYLGKASDSWDDNGGNPVGAVRLAATLACDHAEPLPPMPELELRAAWGDR